MNTNLAPPEAQHVVPDALAAAAPTEPGGGLGTSRSTFTVDGSDELERHLGRTCEKIAAGVRGIVGARRLEGLLLAGGYGRGEGGVLRTPRGDRPYNDLEFYVFLRGNRHLNELRFQRALHVLGEILTPQAGAEVEFKIASRRELAASRVSMFSYDLVVAHRWVVGSSALLARCGHHGHAENIPLGEATRLLMNRCSGLLLARERLQRAVFTPADADFVHRNLAKVQLALGDALLVAHRLYHWSVRERHRRAPKLPGAELPSWLPDVLAHHAAGVEFKLHPERSTLGRAELAAREARIAALAGEVWRWVETRRLGVAFVSPLAYATWHGRKWPEAVRLRNVLLNARALGPRALTPAHATRHPRERILNALALLLWEPRALSTPEPRQLLQRELRSNAISFPEILRDYRALWSRVN